MRLKIWRKQTAHFPKGLTTKEDMELVGKVLESSILRNIKTQKQADGTALKKNPPATLNAKRRYDGILLSLRERRTRGSFTQGKERSWDYQVTRKDRVTIRPAVKMVPPNPARANYHLRRKGSKALKPVSFTNLIKWVQRKGYVGWFGLDKKGTAAVRVIIRKSIKKACGEAAAKSRRARRG